MFNKNNKTLNKKMLNTVNQTDRNVKQNPNFLKIKHFEEKG